jgi:hypothetical protein
VLRHRIVIRNPCAYWAFASAPVLQGPPEKRKHPPLSGSVGTQPTHSIAAMLSAQKVVDGPLLVSGFSDINGSVLNDTIVQRNCSLHIRGNLKGSLTIEPGGDVIVEGSVDGKVVNKVGKLVGNHRAIAQFVRVEGRQVDQQVDRERSARQSWAPLPSHLLRELMKLPMTKAMQGERHVRQKEKYGR